METDEEVTEQELALTLTRITKYFPIIMVQVYKSAYLEPECEFQVRIGEEVNLDCTTKQ